MSTLSPLVAETIAAGERAQKILRAYQAEMMRKKEKNIRFWKEWERKHGRP